MTGLIQTYIASCFLLFFFLFTHPNQPRQTATHPEPGTVGGFILFTLLCKVRLDNFLLI